VAQATWGLGRDQRWRIIIGRWRRSGLSVRAFCRRENIKEPQFYWWRRKLEQADQQKTAFLPVHVVADEAPDPAARGVEVVLANGRCLRVRPGFDADTLVKLVDLLEAGRPSC
jgi:transposase